MKVLFVNCCIRGEASRTLRLCRVAIEAIHTTFPTAEVEELCDRIAVLCDGRLTGLVDARKTTKEEVGNRMTNLVKEVKA